MLKMEKHTLPSHKQPCPASPADQRRRLIASRGLLLACALYILWQVRTFRHAHHSYIEQSAEEICPQVAPWIPQDVTLPAIPDPTALAHLLSGAVQVNTSVYDDDPTVSSSPLTWEATFGPFRQYLRSAFPLTHSDDRVQLELVNQHGLLYTWQGSDASLLPIVFMAHQDVVPVEMDTISSWTHPPFSGFVDDKQGVVFGRGAGDDKASLISLLASFESLLQHAQFKPSRTVILSFGFDEETRGTEGGQALAERLEEIYGGHKEGKGAAMIVDEGEGVDGSTYGIPVAMPAVSEKGYLDVQITVQGKGGHSSEPPTHTTIGILSKFISKIEDSPYVATLSLKEDGRAEDSPGLKTLACLRDAPSIEGSRLGKALERLFTERKKLARGKSCHCHWHRLVRTCRLCGTSVTDRLQRAKKNFLQVARQEGESSAFTTTQAVDLISGGSKINALPERVHTVINHRINVEESVQDVRDRLSQLIKPVAESLGCHVEPWATSSLTSSTGCTIILQDAFDSALEPAPTTPTEGKEAGPYRLLSSVIRSTWKDIRVVPSLMQGNTDTKSYHRLSQHIFRFSPTSLDKMDGPPDGGIHTVDERVQIDTLTKGVIFYTSLMTAVQGLKP